MAFLAHAFEIVEIEAQLFHHHPAAYSTLNGDDMMHLFGDLQLTLLQAFLTPWL
jgi:hypothetical protein